MSTWLVRFGWMAVGVGALYVMTALAGVVSGGPLDPPGPPVASPGGIDGRIPVSTAGTVISEPGSYYLTKDLAAGTSQSGVVITTDDVRLDLNGFSITGNGSSSYGVRANFVRRIAVSNGSIRGFQAPVFASAPSQLTLEDLSIAHNNAGLPAVDVGDGSVIRNVQVQATAGGGLRLGAFADVDGCSVDGSGNNGDTGLQVGAHSNVRNCLVLDFDVGISGGLATQLSDCIVRYSGIIVGDTSTVERCTVDEAGTGIETGAASVVRDCNVRNVTWGIYVGGGTRVERCTVGVYSGLGIFLQGNGLALENVVDSRVGIDPNACAFNVTNSASRIEGNQIVNGLYGVCLGSSGNTVYRNSLRNVTAPFLGAGDIGPTGTAASATSPWANILY
ncbi:MAG: hypothetical protein HY873_06235 [Chloroflexi bacterium]|nr:hypothetical protein [Chloroflexota bacterium]